MKFPKERQLSMISQRELDEIAYSREGEDNFLFVYQAIQDRYPESSGEELRDVFLWCIRELLAQGRLRFLGETWLKDGMEENAPLMFGDAPDGPDDVFIDGLKQPVDPTPDGIAGLIRSKWPPEVVPNVFPNTEGFEFVWFYKWWFEWFDKDGNPVLC